MTRLTYIFALLCATLLIAGCGDDDSDNSSTDTTLSDTTSSGDVSADTSTDTTTGDTTSSDMSDMTTVTETPSFAFGVDPTQGVSSAPFPNDLYLNDGLVAISSLSDDPTVSALAKETVLTDYTAYINARSGFGVSSGVFFFSNDAPDLSTLSDRVYLIALTGATAGEVLPTQVAYNEPAGALSVLPAWGHYLVPDTQYAVLIEAGVASAAGEAFEVAAEFPTMLMVDPPADASADALAARERYAPLRTWLNEGAGVALGKTPADFLVGTLFTTEEVLDYANAVFTAVDGFTLEAPTLRIRYDSDTQLFEEGAAVEGAALDDYFGVPEAPFLYQPGLWAGNRDLVMATGATSTPYEGGSAHYGIGKVINGSFVAPAYAFIEADGAPVNDALDTTSTLRSLIPFTLYLCDSHLADPSSVPVAVFSHGGTVTRSDAQAYANVNCLAGVATIAPDMMYHGSRGAIDYIAAEQLIVPTSADEVNRFNGLSVGDAGYVADQIGDAPASTVSIGSLFAISRDFDPLVIEANMMSVSTDTYTLVRLLKEGDWSQIEAGLSFDVENIFHESLSFGTSMHTVLMAMSDDFRGIIHSVGSGGLFSNILMGPSNSQLASGLIKPIMGLATAGAEIQAMAPADFVLSLNIWLNQRADSQTFAPYVLRQRQTDKAMSVLSIGNSWDETLYSPLQLSYANAFGLGHYQGDTDWVLDDTVPGADSIDLATADAEITANVTYGTTTHTAVNFFYRSACHSLSINNVCNEHFEHPYPPLTPLAADVTTLSPICALQHPIRDFLSSLTNGDALATVGPPRGTCEDLYMP